MNQEPEHDFPYYRSPAAIRGEFFSHRMRGLDEEEVREFLDLLADQVQATEREREQLRAEIDRLRSEIEHGSRASRSEPPSNEISPQAVILFSEAQQVADQLVEEAVIHARDLMASARHQQREILEQAHRAAEMAASQAARAGGHDIVASVTATATEYSTPIPEVEYVRTFARVAQVQLRSVIDALSEEVERLGDVPRLDQGDRLSRLAEESVRRDGAGWDVRTDPVPAQPSYQHRD